jgi:hypothetical protein
VLIIDRRPNAAKHLDEALGYILGHDGVWATTADDIAEYYLAHCYDQVNSWIAERKARVVLWLVLGISLFIALLPWLKNIRYARQRTLPPFGPADDHIDAPAAASGADHANREREFRRPGYYRSVLTSISCRPHRGHATRSQ